jgi:uncharacterized protein YbaP (TraB family)
MKRAVVFLTCAAVLGIACKSGHETPSATTTAPSNAAATASSSAAAASPPAKAAPSDPLPRPLFWSVARDGKTTYLLGTMHVGIDAETRLPQLVWARFHAATTFAMEADLDDAAAAAMIRPTDGSLHDALGDDYWKKLVDAMGPAMARAVDHMPPMVPASTLAMRGLPATEPMDQTLAARAAAEHKHLVYLEPATRQIALLGKWMDIKALKLILDELPEGEQHAHAMIAAYADGDERTLLALSDAERDDALHHGYTAAEYDQEMSDMLYDRNTSWIAEIEQLHATGGGFVAVGALHLLGPHSVLEQLARKGYSVTRLTP